MKRIFVLLPALFLLLASCNDDETDLGINLVDPATLYNGIADTMTVDAAWTILDDSLATSGYSFGIIGNYSDATFGSVKSVLYSQIAIPTGASDINFGSDLLTIDSVVLTLVKNDLYPDSSASYNFHFEVMQLAEAVQSDTTYYACDQIPVDPSVVLFDSTLTIGPTDTVICLKLRPEANTMLAHSASADAFIETVKGLRVRMVEDSDPGMMGINFSATDTRLRVYYSYDTISDNCYRFLIGDGAAHFTHFEHDYSGTQFAGIDSLAGTNRIYFDPMGGLKVRLSFDSKVRDFAAAHPRAVIHYAELLLPVSPEADTRRPDRILATWRNPAGVDVYVDDLLDTYTYTGFDGCYEASRNCYRLRLTQHLQRLLHQGGDKGTTLFLNSRRNAAERTIINGPADSNPLKLVFVYTE